jgi:hypothetical protein
MNKFKLMAIALVVGTMSLFASNVVNPDVSKDEIKKQIVELVNSVENNFTQETTVKLTFTFSTKGEIVVLGINSKDKKVISFVQENINHKIIKNPGKQYKHYKMPFVIKVN